MVGRRGVHSLKESLTVWGTLRASNLSFLHINYFVTTLTSSPIICRKEFLCALSCVSWLYICMDRLTHIHTHICIMLFISRTLIMSNRTSLLICCSQLALILHMQSFSVDEQCLYAPVSKSNTRASLC